MIRNTRRPRLGSSVGAAVLGLALSTGSAHAVTLEELARKMDALEAQNAELRAKVAQLEAAQHQTAQLETAPREAPLAAAGTAAAATAPGPLDPSLPAKAGAVGDTSSFAPATVLSSYGEIGYTRPSKAPNKAQTSVGRAVIGIEHRFDDSTRFVGEWEWENAIVSSTDSGESEVEQLWVEHEFKNQMRGTAGLYLMPAGLINQNHEPTAYYGVFRPDTDMKIIPSTWREVGIALSGMTEYGLTWEGGVSTAPNLSKWDAASDEGRVRGPLAAIHGEGQFAASRDLGVHASLNWRAPGLLVGAFVFTSKVGQQQPAFEGNHSRLVLWDVHGRYEIGPWDLAGEFVRGTISNTDALNTTFLSSLQSPTLVPSLFQGGYVQAAYRLFRDSYYRLSPFVRLERLNTASAFGDLRAGDGAYTRPAERIWTAGANLYLGEGVVFKIDYRHYGEDRYPSAVPPAFTKGNSLNVGMGYSF